MNKRRILPIFLVALAVCITSIYDTSTFADISKAVSNLTGRQTTAQTDANQLNVSFIDVGQGLSVLAVIDGEAMLYDTGEAPSATAVLEELNKTGVKNLRYLVLSHPHTDHIGAATEIMENIPVDTLISPKFTKEDMPTSATYRNILKSIDKNSINAIAAKTGDTYTLGNSATITVIEANPLHEAYNNKSIVMKLSLGEIDFLLTGDAEDKLLDELVGDTKIQNIEVVQTPHHGSRTSVCPELWEDILPQYGVISCGKSNSYMHPHTEVLELYKKLDITPLRTDKLGTVRISTDGQQLNF